MARFSAERSIFPGCLGWTLTDSQNVGEDFAVVCYQDVEYFAILLSIRFLFSFSYIFRFSFVSQN